jgi:hypothetical protein
MVGVTVGVVLVPGVKVNSSGVPMAFVVTIHDSSSVALFKSVELTHKPTIRSLNAPPFGSWDEKLSAT